MEKVAPQGQAGRLASVGGVARYGAADRREMDPNLVRSARDRLAFEQRMMAEAPLHSEVGYCWPPVGHDSHLTRSPWIASHRCVDGAALRAGSAVDERQVALIHFPVP